VRLVGWEHDSLSITGTIPARARFEGGALARRASLDVDSHSGDVVLGLAPKLLDAEVELITVAGTIESSRVTARTPTAGREGRGQALSFTAGSGSARVLVRTFKGTIRLVASSAPAEANR
jgi:hypothetical protein